MSKTYAANNVEVFNPLEHGIEGQPLMVPAHEYNKLDGKYQSLKADNQKLRAELKQYKNFVDVLRDVEGDTAMQIIEDLQLGKALTGKKEQQ